MTFLTLALGLKLVLVFFGIPAGGALLLWLLDRGW